eukprot:COSAG01_NODE_7352_length_3240_cov_13.469003_7_plen_59_part_00
MWSKSEREREVELPHLLQALNCRPYGFVKLVRNAQTLRANNGCKWNRGQEVFDVLILQ